MKSNDEKIINALLTSGTIRGAARAANVSESTVYSRLKDEEFNKQLQACRAEILRETLCVVQGYAADAVRTIGEIMNDDKINSSWRLQAAGNIIKMTVELSRELTNIENAFVIHDEFYF